MKSFLGTPLQVPLSPFFSSKLNFPSPFISPYATGQDGCYNLNNNNEEQINDLQNFQLDEPPETETKDIIIKVQPVIMVKEEIEVEKNVEDESQNQSLQSEDDCQLSQKIKRIVNYLVKNVDKDEERLHLERAKCVADDKQLGQVFDMLVKKFRKLKKTKQQMTKYCMRKAFKFLADKHKKTLECKDNGDFLRQYFQHMQSEAFCIPFKKNSQDKTMNTNFLKKVFSSHTFTEDYAQFLKNFMKLVQEDNNKKIKYLSFTIKTYINTGAMKKLETIKRLPWTQIILDKTIDLANKLITHSPFYSAPSQPSQKPIRKASAKQKQFQGFTSTRRKSSLPQTIGSPIKLSFKH